ncbi:MAG: DMT family protein [Alistipes sp.]|nr:DMT family protein [Alistipes sp.]
MLTRGLGAVALLVCSNLFMTLAWYGQVMFKSRFEHIGILAVIGISWLVALFEYCFMVPANRLGSAEYGGPFSIWELKVIQEVVSLTVFTVIVLLVMKNEALRWNHLVGFACLVAAVFFIFKK